MQQIKAQATGHVHKKIPKSCLFDGGSMSSGLGTSSAFTTSFWIKRSELGPAQKILGDTFGFAVGDKLIFNGKSTGAFFRDPGAWTHIVLAGNGMSDGSLYINGILDSTGWAGSITPSSIGVSLKGYLSEFHFIDGIALDSSHFGILDSEGHYIAVPYTGEYGTNGFYLKFEASDIGTDSSGNGNDFTTSGLTPDSIVDDTPTNNYCTFNPLDITSSTYTYGNLTTTGNATTTFESADGKWYYEKDGVGVSVDGTVGTVGAGTYNFGQRTFIGSAPAGYKTLCTDNLPEPNANPKEHFAAEIYSGSGYVETGFQPGLVWVKRRDISYDHYLVDTVRGKTSALSCNDNGVDEAKASGITSWDDNGFTTGADNGFSGASMASWIMKASGPGVEDNSGNVTNCTVSANKDMGFSIVKYTGIGYDQDNLVPTGLSSVDMVLVKGLDYQYNWMVGSSAFPWGTGYITLNNGDVFYDGSTFPGPIGNGLMNIGIDGALANTQEYIMYCFKNSEMIQSGKYTGNGSTDGSMISLPFKPSFLMVKSLYYSAAWAILDTARSPSNVSDLALYPNLLNAEVSGYPIVDFLSNGFKWRIGEGNGNAATYNWGGHEYLYLAIAGQNFKYARGQ